MNPFDSVRQFEEAIAQYAGSRYAVGVISCSNALLLACKYRQVKEVTIPKRTYVSVPMSIIHAGGTVKFSDEDWSGVYELKPWGIIDGALRFRRGMYVKGSLHCLSFHFKKPLSIGRGGMILTDDFEAYQWLKKARFDGRTEGVPLDQDDIDVLGYNVYMYPEDAAKGLHRFSFIQDKDLPDLVVAEQNYPDLSTMRIFK